MTVAFSAFLHTFTKSPDHLVYHLVIGLSLLIVILLAVKNLRYPEKYAAAKHVLIGCGILFGLQLVLFLLDAFFSPSIFTIYPAFSMIERIIGALVIIWVVWVFIENNHPLMKTSVSIFLSIFMVFFGAASILLNNFDSMVISEIVRLHLFLWQVVTLFLVLLGLTGIYITRPHQWPVGVAILILMGIGYLIQIFEFTPDNIGMGAVRITQTIALPWLLLLSHRFAHTNLVENLPPSEAHGDENQRRIDIKPLLVNELLTIPLKENRKNQQEAVVRAISLSVMADICYLVEIPQGRQQIKLMIGYDLIRDIFIPVTELEFYELPQIMQGWQANRFVKLSQADRETQDAVTLTGMQNYHRIGNLLAYPLNLPDRPLVGGVIFLSPYTDRSFDKESISIMEKVSGNLAQVLFGSQATQELSLDLDELRNHYTKLEEEKQAISQSLAEKDARIKELETEVKQWKAKYQIERLDCVQRIDHMKDEITRLTLQNPDQSVNTEELEQMQAEIRQLNEQKDHLQAALRDANTRISELESLQGQTGPIRLSMESQIISLDAIAANIKMDLSASLGQKQIDLEISNPQGRAMIKTDPALLHSVIQHLLRNAIEASAEGDRVLLNMSLSYETGMLVTQVTDHGRGLTPEEQAELFSVEPSPMPGIGSLQAVREAVRAIRVLNGKIWLKSKKDSFTTFRVQLPVRIID